MPVLPLVGSSSIRPGASSPDASAASTIDFATRSFVEPVGFCPSSFAYSRDPGGRDARELDEGRAADEVEQGGRESGLDAHRPSRGGKSRSR